MATRAAPAARMIDFTAGVRACVCAPSHPALASGWAQGGRRTPTRRTCQSPAAGAACVCSHAHTFDKTSLNSTYARSTYAANREALHASAGGHRQRYAPVVVGKAGRDKNVADRGAARGKAASGADADHQVGEERLQQAPPPPRYTACTAEWRRSSRHRQLVRGRVDEEGSPAARGRPSGPRVLCPRCLRHAQRTCLPRARTPRACATQRQVLQR